MVVTSASLCREVGDTAYAKAHGIAVNLPQVWEALCDFIQENLTAHRRKGPYIQGVVLPGLGTFHIGNVFTTSSSTSSVVMPTFQMTGRYNKISQSQHGNHHRAAGKTVVQPNYHAIAAAAGIDRTACQRAIKDLLIHLGMHVVSGDTLDVDFKVAKLVNRGGRVQMKFALDFFSRFSTSRPRPRAAVFAVQEEEPVQPKPAAAARPSSARHAAARPSTAPPSAPSLSFDSKFTMLIKLCRAKDRIGTGYVVRATLEEFLRRHMRSAIEGVDAMHLLDLLSRFTSGKTAKFVRYAPFVDALQRAASSSSVTPAGGRSPAAAAAQEEYAGHEEEEEEEEVVVVAAPAAFPEVAEEEALESVVHEESFPPPSTEDGTAVTATEPAATEPSEPLYPRVAFTDGSASEAATRASWPYPFDVSLRHKIVDSAHRRANDETNRRLMASRASLRTEFAGLMPKVGHEADARPPTPRTAGAETPMIARLSGSAGPQGRHVARYSYRAPSSASAGSAFPPHHAAPPPALPSAPYASASSSAPPPPSGSLAGGASSTGRSHLAEAGLRSPIVGDDDMDAILRAKREETRRMLRESWAAQKVEKERLAGVVKEAAARWPYTLTHTYPRVPIAWA